MSNRPSPFETEAIAAHIAAAGMLPSAINEASDDFAAGKLGADNIAAWIEQQRAVRPYLWAAKGEAELESAAFGENGKVNLKARSELLQKLGQAAADARAVAWGLKNFGDYSTRPTRPADMKPADNAKEKPNKNPWRVANWNLTEQMRVYRADKALAERLAKAAGSYIGATRPATRPAA